MTVISIRPTIVDLELERGDAAPFTLTAKAPPDETHPEPWPMPLSGCSVRMTLKEKHSGSWDESPAIVSLSWVDGGMQTGITVADLASGIVSIKIPATTMATLVPGVRYKYDCEITDAAGDPVTTHEGDATILADVSR